jgi:uncharacterized iron-regulated membrane protein
MTYWKRWISHPQTVWLRKATFQIHLWSGIGVGLYVLLISVTGSIAVYSNELYAAATREPTIVAESGPRLSEEELKAAVARAYPGFSINSNSPGATPNQAVNIFLDGPSGNKHRLFNPYTGEDLGDSVPLGIKLVSGLLSLHDDLFAGSTGRSVNGLGAVLVIVLALSGIVVWWPGIQAWRRSLTVHQHVGWRRFTWDLHSMIGFWTLGFILLFGLSGVYLAYPEQIQGFADRLDPPTAANAGRRFVDQFIYWLAYLHFGRINGIGIPCRGPGICDQTTKLVWALFGLAPAAMFVTGTLMWWNRVVRKKFRFRR